MEVTLLIYQSLIALTILVLFWVTLLNILHLKKFPSKIPASSADSPLVSVMVPARNEERCVEECIVSLCEQNYAKTEVIVLDDGSTDSTPEILRRLSLKYPALKLIEGTPLPTGWVGKSWACHQLAAMASGEILLFTDADTTHGVDSVGASVEFLEGEKLDFFSIIPFQELVTFGENVVVPMIHMLFFSYIPHAWMFKPGSGGAVGANGQFMCFKRSTYDEIGGHGAVSDALVEDVSLARVLKSANKRIAVIDGSDHVSCRMYTSALEVTRGFSKNIFPSTGYNLPVTILFLLHLITGFIAPLVFLIIGLAILQSSPATMTEGSWGLVLFALPMTQLIMAGMIRLMIALRFRMRLWQVVLQPITAIWSIMIAINSIRWAYSKSGSHWKGRSYKRDRRTS